MLWKLVWELSSEFLLRFLFRASNELVAINIDLFEEGSTKTRFYQKYFYVCWFKTKNCYLWKQLSYLFFFSFPFWNLWMSWKYFQKLRTLSLWNIFWFGCRTYTMAIFGDQKLLFYWWALKIPDLKCFISYLHAGFYFTICRRNIVR